VTVSLTLANHVEDLVDRLHDLFGGALDVELSLLMRMIEYLQILINAEYVVESVLRFKQVVHLISVDLHIGTSYQELLVRLL
jgi:hypothetical protein